MDHGLIAIPVEASELTRPSTGSSFYSGVTSPSGSSEDEFYDAPESPGSQGPKLTESSAEPRISTPLVSTDISPTLQPIDSPPLPTPLDPPTLSQLLPVKLPKPRTFPVREEDFSSLDSVESASETETITAINRHIFTSSPLMETDGILTTETVIPGFNGDTTNILTFLSPNPDSASKEFMFAPINEPSTPDLPPAPNLTPPVPDSELLDETLQNRLLTPDFPPPPSPLSAGNLYPITQPQMQPAIPPNPEKLYPELDMSSPPLWGQQRAHNQLPLSPLTPPPLQDPSGLLNMPQMERNPLYVPEHVPSHPQSDFLLLGSIPPGLVMNPLTQQIMLAQQQVLSQQYPNNIPQVPFPHQMHPNNILPANLMAGLQSFSPHQFNSMSVPFGHFTDGQFDSNEKWNENDEDSLADWKRDLMLKEKRILRDKFGDNRMNGWTERHTNKIDPQETENMSPLTPNSPEHEKNEFPLQTQSQDCYPEDTRPDRICYPSLPLNSSDEEISANNKGNETSKILPGFLSRMKDSNINQQHSVPTPQHDTSNIPHTNNPTLSPHTSTETYDCLTEQPTDQYNTASYGTRDSPMYPLPPPLPLFATKIPEPARTANKPILYPPTLTFRKPSREIKRPPLDTSRSPSPLKPCKREISYPPGLEPSISLKKQIIYYPPTEHRRIRYPPRKDIVRPPNTSFSSFHFNNVSSFLGDNEIIYPHSWTDTSSPKSSPVKQVFYPPRPVVQSDASLEEKIEEMPDIPNPTAGDVTPPIQDSSDNEEVTGTRNCPLESTPIKQSLVTNTEDKPDLDSDLGGFETPTEVD